jgi:glycine/D-amino acid oxidase-like deaminating enzyme
VAQTESGPNTGHSNIFSEYLFSAYQGAAGRPIDSLKEAAGLQVQSGKPAEQLSGMMKMSNIAGTATGEILDFLLLNKIASAGVGKLPPARSAVIFPNEGNLNPYKFSLGLAGSGKFAVHENSPVLGIAVGSPGDGVDVFSPTGTIHAKKVVFATNGPAPMFSFLNDHLVPVQCFATTADIGQKLPGNFFDTDPGAFTYWRQFGVKPFGPTETLIGGTARFLNEMTAEPDAPRLAARASSLFDGAQARDPISDLIFTAYADGLFVASPHPQYPDVWTATGAGGTGLVNGNLMARTIRQQLKTPTEENLVSSTRFGN